MSEPGWSGPNLKMSLRDLPPPDPPGGGERKRASLLRRDRHAQKLLPRRRIVAEAAEHAARHEVGAVLVHAARRHAVVRGLDDDADPLRLEHVVDRVGDLRRQLLLDLQPPFGIDLDDARELLMPTTRPFGT